jgi:CheY-like chemotaxis protein
MVRVVVVDDDETYAVVRRVSDDATHARGIAEIDPSTPVVVARVPADRDALAWVAELRRALPSAYVALIDDRRELTDVVDAVVSAVDEATVASMLQSALARHRAPTEPGPRLALLVIEPDPGLAVVMRRWLGRAYDVTIVATGRRALEELSMTRPDAVLSELYLPDMDAAELHDEIVDEDPELAARTLFMTGGIVVDQARHFLAQIPGQWIAKPFDLTQLRDALQRLAPAV